MDTRCTYWFTMRYLVNLLLLLHLWSQLFYGIVIWVTQKKICTDNVLEFVQNDLQTYYASLGILHHTSCAHTSQQNSVTERKHRHVKDVAHIIML